MGVGRGEACKPRRRRLDRSQHHSQPVSPKDEGGNEQNHRGDGNVEVGVTCRHPKSTIRAAEGQHECSSTHKGRARHLRTRAPWSSYCVRIRREAQSQRGSLRSRARVSGESRGAYVRTDDGARGYRSAHVTSTRQRTEQHIATHTSGEVCTACLAVSRKTEGEQTLERRLEENLPHAPHVHHVEVHGVLVRDARARGSSRGRKQDNQARWERLRQELEGEKAGDRPRAPAEPEEAAAGDGKWGAAYGSRGRSARAHRGVGAHRGVEWHETRTFNVTVVTLLFPAIHPGEISDYPERRACFVRTYSLTRYSLAQATHSAVTLRTQTDKCGQD